MKPTVNLIQFYLVAFFILIFFLILSQIPFLLLIAASSGVDIQSIIRLFLADDKSLSVFIYFSIFTIWLTIALHKKLTIQKSFTDTLAVPGTLIIPILFCLLVIFGTLERVLSSIELEVNFLGQGASNVFYVLGLAWYSIPMTLTFYVLTFVYRKK